LDIKWKFEDEGIVEDIEFGAGAGVVPVLDQLDL
jgi:hypothetical protein